VLVAADAVEQEKQRRARAGRREYEWCAGQMRQRGRMGEHSSIVPQNIVAP